MDMKLSNKYFSAASICNSMQDLSRDVSGNVLRAARAFFKCHGSLPKRIIFYRDGVADGQVS
jgi:aubergine-like protein